MAGEWRGVKGSARQQSRWTWRPAQEKEYLARRSHGPPRLGARAARKPGEVVPVPGLRVESVQIVYRNCATKVCSVRTQPETLASHRERLNPHSPCQVQSRAPEVHSRELGGGVGDGLDTA